ncbi:hypothetical protein FKM82_004794 [Ascaphus truei]
MFQLTWPSRNTFLQKLFFKTIKTILCIKKTVVNTQVICPVNTQMTASDNITCTAGAENTLCLHNLPRYIVGPSCKYNPALTDT